MSGGGKVLANDVGESSCSCPDTHRRHGCQDRVKRVTLNQGLDPGQDLRPCVVDSSQHARQLRQTYSSGTGPNDYDSLFVQGEQDLFSEPVEHLRRPLAQP